MAEQLGSTSTDSLVIIIPTRGEVDWDQNIRNLCFIPISEHDHTGSGNGHRIGTNALLDGAVTTLKLDSNAVTGEKIAPGSVGRDKIANDAINTDKLADDAVTPDKLNDSVAGPGLIKNIVDGSLTIQTDNSTLTITNDVLQVAVISTAQIQDAAITTAKLAFSSVTTDKIADYSVGSSKLATNSVLSSKIANSAVSSAKLATNSVITSKIDSFAVTTDKLANYSVHSTKIATGGVSTNNLANGSVTTDKLLDANVTTNKLAINAVTTSKIAAGNVTASKIGSDVVLSTLNDVSSTAPTTGQVLKWSGTEWGPGTDASAAAGSAVVIGSQTDANAYSPSEGDVVVVNAGVTFTQNLAGVTLITDQNITVQNYGINRVNIHSSASVTLDSNTSPGSHPYIKDCIIKANNIYISNTNKIQKCKLECYSFFFNSTYIMAGTSTQTGVEDSTIICTSTFSNATASVRVKIDRSNITTKLLQGSYNSIDSLITCYDGTTATNAADIQVNGTPYLNSVYQHPFTVNNSGVNANVVVSAHQSSSSYSGGANTDITYNTTSIDNTSSFSSSIFTAKVAGYYKICSNLRANSHTHSNYLDQMVLVNNSSTGKNSPGITLSDASTSKSSFLTDIVFLNVGDTAKIYANSGDTSWTIAHTYTNLSIEKING